MHDIAEFERRGLPGVFVASDQFVDAATSQATSLGFAAVARVFTPHPIQDRTDEEMIDYADRVFEEVMGALTE